MKQTIRTKAAVLLAAILTAIAAPAPAGILEVIVGVSPSCPEGFMGCWGDATQGLRALDGVESVAANPDSFNATASIRLKIAQLPNPEKWREQFQKMLGERIGFRGVEVTVEGTLKTEGDALNLYLPESPQPIRLTTLENKLQWNFKKKRARGPEEEERRAYADLVTTVRKATATPFTVQVTGPLRTSKEGFLVEVREFFVIEPVKQEKAKERTKSGQILIDPEPCELVPKKLRDWCSSGATTCNSALYRVAKWLRG